ncbi:hypothetical protein CDD83_10741 [Cordyceps sp. RAO-2017]|nr:hypothetical protein CDD83_10741 [Cordyceps sp. RAO-2017]
MDSEDELELEALELQEKFGLAANPAARARSSGFLLSLTIGIGGQSSSHLRPHLLQRLSTILHKLAPLSTSPALRLTAGDQAYLSTLGLSKPALSLVWMAGPICGVVLQPYFGMCSDRCRSSWGRRRPFIFFGALAAISSLLCLASAERLAYDVARVLGLSGRDSDVKTMAATSAVLSVAALNIAIQPLQGGMRALIVDTVPPHQQQTANAWAGAVTSTTNVMCYLLSSVDVTRWLGGLGDSRFTVLCVATSLLLAVTVGVTCTAAQESSCKVPVEHEEETERTSNIAETIRRLCCSFPRLPRQVRSVLKVQFFSWMGWFPFLYYITTYIGDLWLQVDTAAADLHSRDSTGTSPSEKATQVGSAGLIVFSLVSLMAGTAVPSLMAYARQASRGSGYYEAWYRSPRRVWITTQLLFASCMFATLLVSSLWHIYLLVGLSGISWGITIWAPHAIISSEISEPGRYGDAEDCERRPGIVVGLHNAAIAGPQIVAAVGCSLLFRILEGTSGDSVGWTLRVGGLSMLVASWLSLGIRE